MFFCCSRARNWYWMVGVASNRLTCSPIGYCCGIALLYKEEECCQKQGAGIARKSHYRRWVYCEVWVLALFHIRNTTGQAPGLENELNRMAYSVSAGECERKHTLWKQRKALKFVINSLVLVVWETKKIKAKSIFALTRIAVEWMDQRL